MRWTGEQVCILVTRLQAGEGIEAAAEALADAGFPRGLDAVRRKAYRMGLPTIRWDVCVQCGVALKPEELDGDGLCAGCRKANVLLEEVDMWKRTWAELERNGHAAKMEARGFQSEIKSVRRSRKALRKAAEKEAANSCQ